jgi:type II secretory pathway predicted ATPase ExeA
VEHLQHFGLSRDPFCNEPIPDQFLEVAPHREALLRLGRAVQQRRGLCVLAGQEGSGKTMALRQLFDSLEEEMFEASMMVVLNAGADAGWIMGRFARQLGIAEPAAERETLVAQIYEQLAIVREDGRHAVLLIDDAEVLAHGRTLVDVCGLLKLEYEDRRLLTLVLSGGPVLGAALAADPALVARVEVKVTLPPLEARVAHDYLTQRIRGAGGVPAILHEGALDAIHELGRGLPGRMNTLADNALFEAFLAARRQVTRTDVERAHRDLAWSGGPAPAGPAGAAAPDLERLAAPMYVPLQQGPFDPLDSELDAAFAIGPQGGRVAAEETFSAAHLTLATPREGPPKESEDDVEDLLVELIED